MNESVIYLKDYLAEGTAELAATGTEGAATISAESPNVSLNENSLPEEAKGKGESIQTTPKPKKTRAPKEIKEAVTSINVPTISDFPQPGGIAFLLFLIVFILFAFKTTANGQTRLGLIWATMRGQATITDNPQSASLVTGAFEGVLPQLPQGSYDGAIPNLVPGNNGWLLGAIPSIW